MMDNESFASMLLKSIRMASLPVADVERLHENKWLFGVEMSDKSEFLLKIRKRDAEQEAYLMGVDETNSKIHDIYERYTNSWEFNETLMHIDFNITWLLEELDYENYRKLKDYILCYCSRNDELLFRLGLKYAWSLFHDRIEKEKMEAADKSKG